MLPFYCSKYMFYLCVCMNDDVPGFVTEDVIHLLQAGP
jgi:hypothetical protein